MSFAAINVKGMAYVSNREEFESFIVDFHILGEETFEDLADWYKFFCEGDTDLDDEVFVPDILQLISELNETLVPNTFPAFVMFDFTEFNPKYMHREEATFNAFPVIDLDIRKIETRTDEYQVHFVE